MAVSRKQIKNGLWSAISFITCAFLTIGFQDQIPLKFTSRTLKANYYLTLIISIPIAFGIVVSILYWLQSKRGIPIVHMLAGIIGSIILFVSAGLLNFVSTTWHDEQILYQGRFTSKTIIQQYDGWNGANRLIESTPVFTGLRWINPVDTSCISKQEWTEVPEKEGYRVR